MKGLLVVRNPSMPDIVFLSADKAFIQHLNKAAVDKGLMMEDELEDDRLDISVATQFFSPIIASQGAMTNELHTPYSSITCENGFCLVLRSFGEHLYIALSGEGGDTEEFLQRKLLVFNRLITFYYGPAVEQMSPNSMNERKIVWQELDTVLQSWAELYSKEQCFLVEALERLQVNQTVNEMCISLLENVLHKLKGAGDKNAVHAMVIVHAKLLALYSSRRASELQSSDLLLITLLAHSFFPSSDSIEEFMTPMKSPGQGKDGPHRRMDSNQTLTSNSGEEYHSAGESEGGSSYYSPDESDDPNDSILLDSGTLNDQETLPFETAKLESESSSSQSEVEDDEDVDTDLHRSLDVTPTADIFHTPVGGGSLERTPVGAEGGVYNNDDTSTSSQLTGSATPTFSDPQLNEFRKSARSKLQGRVSIAPSDVGSSGEGKTCVRMPAFLQLVSCNCAPHILYFAPILPGITLVVLSEMRVQLAKVISQCLYLLDLINRRQSGTDLGHNARNIEETLDGLIKQVCDQAKRLRFPSLNDKQKSLTEQWELVKQCGLQKYLDEPADRYMSPRLESALPEVTKLLKRIFEIRYLGNRASSRKLPEKIESAMYDLQLMLQENLCHYEQYLAVKAQRNITMTTYLEDFPGLVHFIHVDRKTDQLTAPSINVASQTSKASVVLRDQVWQMVNQMHEFLQQGYFTAAMRHGDFYFSYFLYFEDVAGKLLPIQKPLKTERSHGLPGILTGNFFKEIVQRCFPNAQPGSIRCCELVCLHLSVVPLQYIASHARRLCRSLWETSGEAATPVNLL